LVIPIIAVLSANLMAVQLEFSVSLAVDRPLYKTLPGLSSGIGWGFSIGLLPIDRAGFSVGANSTQHKMDADTSRYHLARGDSRRVSLYFQGHYCFLRLTNYDFEAYLGASYNSINGGDKNGSHLDLQIDPDEMGYTGWGALVGVGVVHQFAKDYSLQFAVRYNMLSYTKHDFPSYLITGPESNRQGSSLVFNLGIIFKVDFADF
jgi:hypothetical protein